MNTLLLIDWKSVFVPTVQLGEIFLRGTIVYLFILFVLRLLRREAGSLSISVARRCPHCRCSTERDG